MASISMLQSVAKDDAGIRPGLIIFEKQRIPGIYPDDEERQPDESSFA
jgi:hypothetical protein